MLNNFSITNIYEKPCKKSKLSSQMLYGEKFRIISKKSKWLKIKTNYDNYIGYIRGKKFVDDFKPNYKVSSLKSKIFFKKKNKFQKSNQFLYFGSRILVKNQNKAFVEFEKNKWIKKKDISKIFHYERNFDKIFKLFLNVKYLWGGKSANGIDCSSLLQIYFFYNRIFFPRDTKDQIQFYKKKLIKNFRKGNIIFWKGHVAICLNKSKLIHAYGPEKKVLVMDINSTIKLIKKTATLPVKKICNFQKS